MLVIEYFSKCSMLSVCDFLTDNALIKGSHWEIILREKEEKKQKKQMASSLA